MKGRGDMFYVIISRDDNSLSKNTGLKWERQKEKRKKKRRKFHNNSCLKTARFLMWTVFENRNQKMNLNTGDII